MLPGPNCLKQSSGFDRAYKKGCHYRGKYGKLVVFRRGSDDDGPTRIGIVVSGKQGKAHVRNRAKRQIREVFRKNLSKQSPWCFGCDVTFICWDVSFDYSEIEKDITGLVDKVRQ